MFWGTEGYGSTVSEMEGERGTIYGGVGGVGARAAVEFGSRIVCKIVQMAQVLAERLFSEVGPERDLCRVGEVGWWERMRNGAGDVEDAHRG